MSATKPATASRAAPASPNRPTFAEAMADVARHFEQPEALLLSRDFDRAQKVALLRQWDTDLRLLMVAAEENMPPEGTDRTGDQMRLVHAALAALDAGPTEEGAPTKTGG